MKVDQLQIMRNFDDEINVTLEIPVSINLTYSVVDAMLGEVVSNVMDTTDIKMLSYGYHENDNTVYYVAYFNDNATLEYIYKIMQGLANDTERILRNLKAILDVIKVNRE